jgi:hypothetical protein
MRAVEAYPARAMGSQLESETRIVIGRLAAPTTESRAWWWEASTTVEGAEVTVAGFAETENDAILEAAARSIELRGAIAEQAAAAPKAKPRPPEPDFWGVNGDRAPARDPDPDRSASGSPDTQPDPRSATPR